MLLRPLQCQRLCPLVPGKSLTRPVSISSGGCTRCHRGHLRRYRTGHATRAVDNNANDGWPHSQTLFTASASCTRYTRKHWWPSRVFSPVSQACTAGVTRPCPATALTHSGHIKGCQKNIAGCSTHRTLLKNTPGSERTGGKHTKKLTVVNRHRRWIVVLVNPPPLLQAQNTLAQRPHSGAGAGQSHNVQSREPHHRRCRRRLRMNRGLPRRQQQPERSYAAASPLTCLAAGRLPCAIHVLAGCWADSTQRAGQASRRAAEPHTSIDPAFPVWCCPLADRSTALHGRTANSLLSHSSRILWTTVR
jgi:hypothetical protein